MRKDRISWAIPTLSCALIFVIVFGISMLMGVNKPSLFGLGLDFLAGSFIGYVLWTLFL